MRLVGDAVDQTRRQERAIYPELKGQRYTLLRKPETMSDAQLEFASSLLLSRKSSRTARAFHLKLAFADFWTQRPEQRIIPLCPTFRVSRWPGYSIGRISAKRWAIARLGPLLAERFVRTLVVVDVTKLVEALLLTLHAGGLGQCARHGCRVGSITTTVSKALPNLEIRTGCRCPTGSRVAGQTPGRSARMHAACAALRTMDKPRTRASSD